MKSGTRTDIQPNANLHQVSLQDASDKLNVSRRTVASVKEVERKAPELMPKLESGEMTANEASRIIRR